MNTDLDIALKDSAFKLWDGDYAVLKVDDKEVKTDYFMISKDSEETTLILSDKYYYEYSPFEEEKWFKLIEIKVSVPFQIVGFLAAISTAVANEGLTILIVSTFSKDYVLVRKETVNTVIHVLKKLGLTEL